METTHTNRKNVIIRYACLVLFIILMGIDIFLGKSLSSGVSKLPHRIIFFQEVDIIFISVNTNILHLS